MGNGGCVLLSCSVVLTAVLSRLRGLPADHPYIRNEMDGINMQLEEEKALATNNSGLTLAKEAFTVRSYLRRSILYITLMM
ncbi:hypothetical protein B0J13DRAFT_574954 [Dactylonectria estremocensis]|uniref:Uncharacterized protein n=1 Tax=Dactylonectria estremocensis TaxID=1079267 RepID=A0A9P9D5I0_9HYPO|nr:hypothetical protein B0J13DRAFT_574954 [Dactylonectria estremocensis]